MQLFSLVAGGDLTVSLTDGSLATLEGIQLQLAANLVGQNVQISGIDAASINNITLQVGCSQFLMMSDGVFPFCSLPFHFQWFESNKPCMQQ